MADEEKKQDEASTVKGPVQGPITNFYVDKVVTKEAFVEFIKKQYPNHEQHGYTIEGYIFALLHAAYRHFCPYGTDCSTDFAHLATFKPFFSKFLGMAPDGDRHYYPTGAKVQLDLEKDWAILRDVLRFQAYDQLLTKEYRARLTAEGTELYRQGFSLNNVIIFQREPLPYRKKLKLTFKIDLDPSHMVHLSPKDSAFIRYTPDEKSRERDVTVETTVSKYLRKFHPSLTDAQLQQIAEIHKFECSDGGVHFYTSPEDIQNVYKNGPQSCMSKGDAAYIGPQHPSVMYANSPGVRLACLPSGDKTWNARCFVYDNPDDPKDKRMIRVYGDGVLQRKLEKMGYVLGSWRGAKLRKVQFKDKFGKPLPETYIVPYIDDIVGGNGRDGSAQCLFTEEDWDYWVVVDRVQGEQFQRSAKEKKARYTYISGCVTDGAVGKHIGYNYMRHNSMEVRGTARYHEPVYERMNEWKEFRCRNCGGIFDEEFHKPYIWSAPVEEPKPNSYLCLRCVEQYRGSRWWKTEIEGQQVFVNPSLMFAIRKEDGAVECLDRLKWTDTKAMEAWIVVFEKELIEKHKVVRLYSLFYSDRRTFWPVDKSEELSPGVWAKKEDVVDTLFGKRSAKMACYFLGQSSKGVFQYVNHDDNDIFMKAVQKGKVFIVDGKLEFVERGAFQPKHRKKYFEALGELEEEEDGLVDNVFEQKVKYEEPIPLIEVLNVLWSFYETWLAAYHRYRDVGAIMQSLNEALHRIYPRVAPDVWYLLSHSYATMKVDSFAGVEGVMSISPQLSTALLQGLLQDGETEVDQKTGEVFLTEKAIQRLAYSRDFVHRLGSGASTAYVKVRSHENEKKLIRKAKQARPRPAILGEEVITLNTIQAATRVRVR